ncbi:unnamed protein product, partial [Gulo gulo]
STAGSHPAAGRTFGGAGEDGEGRRRAGESRKLRYRTEARFSAAGGDCHSRQGAHCAGIPGRVGHGQSRGIGQPFTGTSPWINQSHPF